MPFWCGAVLFVYIVFKYGLNRVYMDSIRIQDRDFALTTDVLKLMQSSWESLQSLGKVGMMETRIISGCLTTDGIVGPGVVCLMGEVLPFAGGTPDTYVIATETVTNVQVGGGSYTSVARMAVFSESLPGVSDTGDPMPWILWDQLRSTAGAVCFRDGTMMNTYYGSIIIAPSDGVTMIDITDGIQLGNIYASVGIRATCVGFNTQGGYSEAFPMPEGGIALVSLLGDERVMVNVNPLGKMLEFSVLYVNWFVDYLI
jgi:hypothetical protein